MKYPKASFRYPTRTLVKFGHFSDREFMMNSYRLRKGILLSSQYNYRNKSDSRFCHAVALSEAISLHLGKDISPLIMMSHFQYHGGIWIELNGRALALVQDLARKMKVAGPAQAISQAINECITKYDPPKVVRTETIEPPPAPPEKSRFSRVIDAITKIARPGIPYFTLENTNKS